jgi:hypothetical protein
MPIFDLNRPQWMAKSASGRNVVMFLDAPGEFWFENMEPCSPGEAKTTGWDIEKVLLEAEKKKRHEQLRKQVEAEFSARAAASDGSVKEHPKDVPLPGPGPAPDPEEAHAVGDVVIKHRGRGTWDVLSGDGSVLLAKVSKEEASSYASSISA